MLKDWLEQGLRHHRAGRTREAISFYNQVIAVDPRHPDALHLLGLIALQSGQPAAAADLIHKAAAAQPRNWAYWANLGQALIELRQFDDALAALRTAGKLNRDEPRIAMSIANCLALRGDLPAAEERLRKLAHRHPAMPLAWFNLGNAVRDQGRAADALALYERAIQLDPDLVDAHNNRGTVLQALGRLEEAEAAYRHALARGPATAMGLRNLASVLIDRGRFAEAEAVCRQALAVAPESAIACSFLAAAIGSQGRLLEALEFDRKALALEPQNVDVLTALGTTLYGLGRTEEALPLLRQARSLQPQSWYVDHFLAGAHLALGEFKAGWDGYRHRDSRQRFQEHYPDVVLASSLPPVLSGKHVLVRREQGLGDELFFLRFAPEIRKRGGRITYCANAKIASLLGRVPAIDRVLRDGDPLPPADYTLLVGDLPLALASDTPSTSPAEDHATSAALPPPLPLTPLPDQLAKLRQQLAQLSPPPYLGLTWRGGTTPEEQRAAWVLFKEIPLAQLGAAVRGVNGTLLALQRNPRSGEIEQLARATGKPVHDVTALNEDLEAMLALLALIDDYIGVSNTNMHLRAGAGRASRVLAPCPAEWRWMAGGDESPWFPGFRIYRQTPDGDWSAPLARLGRDLDAAFDAHDD